MQNPSPSLLEALYALKPNAIYTMATPKAIVSAAALFSQNVVSGFRWGESGKLLQIVFKGSPSISVRFSCEDGALVSSCDCGAPSRPSCRHVLVSAMTVARILHEAKFHEVDLPGIRIVQFRHQLKIKPKEATRAKVYFTPRPGQAAFEIDYDSGKREASWRVAGTPENMEWLKWQDTEPESVAAAFGDWLEAKPENTDVEVRVPSGTMEFSEIRSREMNGRTHLQVEGSSVVIKRTLLDASGQPAEPFLDLGYGLALLPEHKSFARITPRGAWDGFANFSNNQPGSQKLSLDVSQFWTRTPLRPESRCTLLDRDGRETEWTEIEGQGAMVAITDESSVRLSLRIRHDGRELMVHQQLLGQFRRLFVDGPFSLLAQSPGRRRRLAELLVSEIKEDSWGAISRDPAFISPAMHGDDAVKCLRTLRNQIQEMDEKHLLADPLALNPWQACSQAGTAALRLVEALVLTFPGEDILRSKDFIFTLDSAAFFERLPHFSNVCASLGIDLRLNGGTVAAQTATLSLKALPAGSIDWFELHPELQAGTLTIPRSAWAEILRTGKYTTEDQETIALDAASLETLRKVTGLLGLQTGGEVIQRLRLFDLLALRKEGAILELPSEYASVLESLQNFESITSSPLPKGLKANLRAYQHHGYDWLSFLYRHRFGACLADDMGLGKTLQAIALLQALHEGGVPKQSPHPHLVVLPPTLLFNWQNELTRFAPALEIREYTGQKRVANFAGADVILTTYDLARRDIEILAKVNFDVIIFDEAQAIKNPAASRTQAMKRLNGRFRLCLTGTPLENHIGEFLSIMEAAVPGIFGDQKRLAAQQEAGFHVLDRARPFILRRTKEKILSELPPKIESDVYFPLSDRQKEYYTRAVGDVREEVLAAYQERPAQQAGIMALAALMRLRQICISPAMLTPEFDEVSPKLDFLTEQLAEIIEAGHAAIIFSQFVKALDLVANTLTESGLSFIRMDGSTPTPRRKELVETFQNGQAPGIFLISLKTGGAGLNLTRASYVYHLDPWWNPAVENQASDRAHRIGQTNSVYVQRLLMRHTIEEKMMTLKQHKKDLFAAVVDRNEAASLTGEVSLKPADFQFLLSQD